MLSLLGNIVEIIFTFGNSRTRRSLKNDCDYCAVLHLGIFSGAISTISSGVDSDERLNNYTSVVRR
jgi:hypothetical protein